MSMSSPGSPDAYQQIGAQYVASMRDGLLGKVLEQARFGALDPEWRSSVVLPKERLQPQMVTDILVLRRREADRVIEGGADDWLHTAPLTVAADDGTDTEIDINSYFHDHPENILGRPSLGHGIHGHQTLNVTADESSSCRASRGNLVRPLGG